jgi:hypothetical protein
VVYHKVIQTIGLCHCIPQLTHCHPVRVQLPPDSVPGQVSIQRSIVNKASVGGGPRKFLCFAYALQKNLACKIIVAASSSYDARASFTLMA